ncbi:dehydrodolichyl diphosphate synthase complex subunit nus1 isoform X1 [Thalassophryne amazonica]|uniref:dehydrodolichyl diphosphate synthase complex subunit nus1 isoform X1 n=1 Tax=Thalassophryne amazonica TaxID=390379 RepID=UPI001470F1DF|nr:dehydrodolichyl diphosphate synthase complex subunit nus1 isoform X1 [Thalassophryne amazonica]
MALLLLFYGFLWRLLLLLVYVHKALLSWLRVRLWDRCRWPSGGDRRPHKVPVHIGLLVAEEPSLEAVADLVVWCSSLGVSYISVYDQDGNFQKNNAHLLDAIMQQQQQQDLLGADGSKYNIEFLSSDKHGVLLCRPRVMVLSPEDGKQSIVHAAQQLCRSVENKETSYKDISVSMLDSLLRVPCHLTKRSLLTTC